MRFVVNERHLTVPDMGFEDAVQLAITAIREDDKFLVLAVEFITLSILRGDEEERRYVATALMRELPGLRDD